MPWYSCKYEIDCKLSENETTANISRYTVINAYVHYGQEYTQVTMKAWISKKHPIHKSYHQTTDKQVAQVSRKEEKTGQSHRTTCLTWLLPRVIPICKAHPYFPNVLATGTTIPHPQTSTARLTPPSNLRPTPAATPQLPGTSSLVHFPPGTAS